METHMVIWLFALWIDYSTDSILSQFWVLAFDMGNKDVNEDES